MFDWVDSAWNSLPEPLRDPVALAIPAFVVLLAIEWFAAARLEDGEPGSYKASDARASLGMGVVSIATTTAWKTLALFGYAALYAYVAPWQLPAGAWYTWVILILGVDFLFYAYHRIAHRTRIIWATHQAHHSSEYFNFSTALRQKWNNSGEIVMWLPCPSSECRRGWCSSGSPSTSSISSGSTPSESANSPDRSSSCSTLPRTTASTTGVIRSTWTRTTAGCSSSGTACSARTPTRSPVPTTASPSRWTRTTSGRSRHTNTAPSQGM